MGFRHSAVLESGERDGIDRFSSYIVVFVLPPALDTRCGQATFFIQVAECYKGRMVLGGSGNQ